MRTLSIFLFLVLSVSISNSQDRWEYVASNHDNTDFYYYDTKSITNKSGSIIVWLKIVPSENRYSDYNKKYLDYSLEKIEYYCGKRKSKTLDFYSYYTDGTSHVSALKFPIADIIPETLGEALYLTFCNE